MISEGVDTIFGYQEAQLCQFMMHLYDYNDRLKHILVRHEQSAIHQLRLYQKFW